MPVADGYGSREGGFIAHQCPLGAYHVTMESHIVELLDANDRPVVDGECGLVVPAGDVAALAKAMEWLYDHPGERTRLGAAARDRIGRHFRSEDTVAKTLALYDELMAD